MDAKTANKPRQGRRTRPTSLSLPFAIWDRLKEIQRETGAPPSATATRILYRELKVPPSS